MIDKNQFWYSKTDLRNIANSIKKALKAKGNINDDTVFEVSQALGLGYDAYEDNYWYLALEGVEGVQYSGTIARKELKEKSSVYVEEYYKSNTVQKGINFTVDVTDEEKKEIRCYVNTYIYHKYMAYDESEEITLFTISL